jgi:ABC-type polysaccharide/polyol phosphate transport system ATPase subunit
MTPIIQFQNVSKLYYLGSKRAYLRYLLPGSFQRDSKARNGQNDGELWALKDFSFEVEPGESVGLIGPNGAGKTTTLSILAGITQPTSGEATVQGRVGALIQLGAGFHPELTGRENIYLNGVIMGLSTRKINQIIDEIIEFSELEKFIDTPIKRYSSGMNVRLGFSIAVNLNPDILLIDEVLAVGDASFKSKCFGKLRGLRQSGVTVILVSHEMSQIRNLCDRAIFIKNQLIASGDVNDVIQCYYDRVFSGQQELEPKVENSEVSGSSATVARISSVELLNQQGERTNQYTTGETLRIRINYQANEAIESPAFGVSIHSDEGLRLIGVNTQSDNYEIRTIEGKGSIEFIISSLPFLHGSYLVSVGFHDQFMGFYDRKNLAYKFYVTKGPPAAGVIYPDHEWKLTEKQ